MLSLKVRSEKTIIKSQDSILFIFQGFILQVELIGIYGIPIKTANKIDLSCKEKWRKIFIKRPAKR